MKFRIGNTSPFSISGGSRVFAINVDEDWLFDHTLRPCVVLQETRLPSVAPNPVFTRAFSLTEAKELLRLLEKAIVKLESLDPH